MFDSSVLWLAPTTALTARCGPPYPLDAFCQKKIGTSRGRRRTHPHTHPWTDPQLPSLSAVALITASGRFRSVVVGGGYWRHRTWMGHLLIGPAPPAARFLFFLSFSRLFVSRNVLHFLPLAWRFLQFFFALFDRRWWNLNSGTDFGMERDELLRFFSWTPQPSPLQISPIVVDWRKSNFFPSSPAARRLLRLPFFRILIVALGSLFFIGDSVGQSGKSALIKTANTVVRSRSLIFIFQFSVAWLVWFRWSICLLVDVGCYFLFFFCWVDLLIGMRLTATTVANQIRIRSFFYLHRDQNKKESERET